MISNLMIKHLLRNSGKITATVLFVSWAATTFGLPVKNDSLRFEILMSGKMLNEVHLNEKFINTIDITPNRHILLSTSDQFYLLGWGGMVPFAKKNAGTISSFAYTTDNFLITIRNSELCYFDSTGNLTKLYKLPGEGMGISAGKNVMYVYDRNKGKTKYSLYVVAKGGKYVRLFDVPAPVTAVTEMKNSLLFATENGLFSFDLKRKELKAMAALPQDKEIKSIAVDTLNSRIYFSTGNALYTLNGSSVLTVTDKFGGVLRFLNDGLLLFDSEKNNIIRMVGIENELSAKILTLKAASTNKRTSDTLTNLSIINMVEAKLSDEFIINLINKSDVNFMVNVDAMIELSNHNVSSEVISGMKTAMKRKTAGIPKSRN